MGKHAGLAHAHHFRQGTNADALQAELAGQRQACIQQHRTGLLAFLQDASLGAVGAVSGLRRKVLGVGHGWRL